jgi:hypothetical protein
MKHGFFKGKKVAECQDSQTSLMDRFKKQGLVDEWRDAGAKQPDKAEADSLAEEQAKKAAADKAEADRAATEKAASDQTSRNEAAHPGAEKNKKAEEQRQGSRGRF